MEKIRLFDLANLAIGTPEVGAANFTALHSLLHAILKQLQIQDVNVELPEGKYHPVTGMLVKIEDKGQEDRMELRIVKMEKQLEILNSLPSGLDLIERSKSGQKEDDNTVGDMWQMMKISRRLELNEEGVCKAMTVMQDLLVEVNTLKESQHWVQDQTQKVAQSLGLGNLQDLHLAGVKAITENGIESIQKELESLKTRLKNLEDKLEALCDTLARHPETKDAWTYALGPSADDINLTFGAVNVTDISSSKGPVLYTSQTVSQPQSSSHAEVSASHMDTPHGTQDGVTASISQDPQTKTENSGRSDEINLTHGEASIIQNTGIPFPMTSMTITASPGSLSSHVDIPHSIQDGMTASILQDPQTKNSGQSDSINLTNQEAPVIQNTGIDLPMTSMDITASPGSLASHMDTPHATQDGITAPILQDPQTENSGQSEEIKSTHQEAPMIQNTGIDLPMTSVEITASPGSLSSHVDIPHATQDGMTATILQDPQIKKEISGQSDEISLTHPEASMPQNTGIDLPMPSIDPGAAPGSLGVSTAHQPGDISKELCPGVDALERNKADHIELKLLQKNTDDLATAVPDLQEKISCVNKEMQDLIGEKKAMDPVVTHTDQKLGDTNQTNQHFGSLSTTIQNIEKELKELRDRQEREKSIMEQSLSQKSLQLQDQLDTLREILTTMASSSSTLLAMSIPKESGGSTPALDVTADTKMPDQGTTQTQAPVTTSASTEHLTCPACTIDIGQKVSKLVNQYEDLQELVTDYTSSDQSSKDVLERRKTADLCMQFSFHL
ncbi:uncharacterized protein [Engystomops pustulosus]|uniref:uncharacterized protein n=1 Tax=Engystomops pustulosus TaxID=76066 RepID=UPI003AFA4BF2